MRIASLLAFCIACTTPAAEPPTAARLELAAAIPAALIADPGAIALLGMAPLEGSELVPLLAGTDAGRQTLTLLVGCALGPDQALSAGGIDFFGDSGLAPGWISAPLTCRERQLMTGCALALLSADGLPTVVSLRAGAVLPADAAERSGWPVAEGAFFGDLFDADVPVAAACRGRGQLAEPHAAGLAHRFCATPDPAQPGLTRCGLAFAGDCAEVCRDGRCRIGGERFRAVSAFVAE